MLPSGAVLFILIVSVLLAAGVAWIVAAFYERRMLALMTHGAAPEASAGEGAAPTVRDTAWGSGVDLGVDLAANRRATVRLMAALGGISLLIAVTQSALALFFVYDNRTLSVNRLL